MRENKLDILAVGAHPDDVELGCGGTVAKAVAQGKKVGILDLTRGELGTRGTAEIRDQEAAEAAQMLQVAVRENLEFSDGFFKDDESHQRAVVEVLRAYRPETVLCSPPQDRHPDHPKAATLVQTACFLSGLPKIKTTYRSKVQTAWRPRKVFHYIQWQNLDPHFLVDISDFIDVKMEAVLAYKSQFYNPNSQEAETPISNKNFLESIRYRAKDLGRYAGVDHAEGFISQMPLTLTDDLSFF